ncbi:hypothetical protein BAE44_0020968 [Dichanthelium oligosanthes]|uniref:Uncharacterized protein n=1 Tax=Dichanthelium oligosanthes TaxID=888268 RepID=A0A1E5UYM8_9POAL|nr:hypothetical protein BAE44_0020968 [Dichanthelium oligosanthes]
MLELEKDALALVIKMLGPGDRLAVVPFFDDVAKDPAAKEMKQLVAMSDERKEKIGALILMERDDSILTEKEWSRVSVLKEPKYRAHTFGFSDHKADTLRHIADKTHGTYFPDDIASNDDLHKLVASFGSLVSRPFTAVDVRVDLGTVHPGVSISKIESGEKSRRRPASGSGYVDVGTFNAGETTEFTVYLDVSDGEADAMVLVVDGSYTQGWDGGKHAKLGRSVIVGGYEVQTE